MKEIFIIRTNEEDFLKQAQIKMLLVPEDHIFRSSLYVACLDVNSKEISYIAKVNEVQIEEEKVNDDIDVKALCELQLKIGPPVKLSKPVCFSEEVEPCDYITFEELLMDQSSLDELLKSRKKITKKEVSLIVARYLEQGISYSISQKLDEAYELFNLALDMDKKNYLIYFYLGNIYVDKANVNLAIYYYKKAIELNEKFHHAYNYLGLAYSYISKIDYSIRCWEETLNLNANDEFALINLGKSYIQTKKYAKAIEILKGAKELNQTNLFILNLLGVAYANTGELDLAIEHWTKIVESGHDDEYLHLNLARAYFESRRYREALEEYETILEMFPKGHDLHKLAEQNIEILRAKVSEKNIVINEVKDISPFFEEKFGIALPNIDEELSKTINLNKLADYVVLFELDKLKIKSIIFDKTTEGDDFNYEEAAETLTIYKSAYKSTIKLRKLFKKLKTSVPQKENITAKEEPPKTEPEDKEQVQIRSVQTTGTESSIPPEEIQNVLEQAKSLVAMEPNNEWAHYSLGTVFAQMGDFKGASSEFKISSTINPNNAIAWYALGLSFVRMNLFDEAIQALQQAIISVPDTRLTSVYEEWNYKDSLAYFGLGDVYIRKGMFDEAVKIFKKGLSIDATSALAHFQLGTCYEVKGEYDPAIESLLNCLSLNPNFAFAYSKLGIIYYKKELYNEALTMLLKAVGYENPDSESYFYLGEVYVKIGKIEDAKYCHNMVLQISPRDDMYYVKSQKILTELNTIKSS